MQAKLIEVCGPQESHHGLVWAAGEQDVMFYEKYVRIVGGNPIWVQSTLTTLVRMFEQVGLYNNLVKTKSMTFTTGFI